MYKRTLGDRHHGTQRQEDVTSPTSRPCSSRHLTTEQLIEQLTNGQQLAFDLP